MRLEKITYDLIAFKGNTLIYKSRNENAKQVFFYKKLSIRQMELIDENQTLLISQDYLMKYRHLTLKREINNNVMSTNRQMEYPKCSNGNCMHNDKYLCKAKGLDEDIVCKQGKADDLCREESIQ